MDAIGFIELLWRGFQMIGGALVGGIRALLGFFHVDVPDWAIEIATIIILVLIVIKWGKVMWKILLIVLLVVLASTMIHLLI